MMQIGDLVDLVKEQLQFEKVLNDGSSMDDPIVNDFAFATTALAKQMMETTQDAALNAKTVLGYGLPASFDELQDQEAKKMIEVGNFYPLGKKLLQLFKANELPLPDPERPLSAFLDVNGAGIEEDSQSGGGAYDYTAAYKAHMKELAKEFKIKGKNLFHPIRLALTGEMSGQDVTKQLSLLAMACQEDNVVDAQAASVISFSERMNRLDAFLETIPEEFRAPRAKEEKKEAKPTSNEEKETKVATAANPVSIDPKDTYEGPPIAALDIRVGRILKVWEHEEADKLYCEEIDVGEEEPRKIASGLKPYLKSEDMEGRLCLVLCNLKERKLVGFPSHGMVLCASNSDHTEVRLVAPPVDAVVGERVTVPDFDFEEDGTPFAPNKIGKKKVFEKLGPFLVTNKYGVPEFLDRPLMTSGGVCTSPISNGSVS